MKDRFQGLWGMGARPHVSEAKLPPNEDARTLRTPSACALFASSESSSRHDKQLSVLQVLA